jgi:hypothetical protein
VIITKIKMACCNTGNASCVIEKYDVVTTGVTKFNVNGHPTCMTIKGDEVITAKNSKLYIARPGKTTECLGDVCVAWTRFDGLIEETRGGCVVQVHLKHEAMKFDLEYDRACTVKKMRMFSARGNLIMMKSAPSNLIAGYGAIEGGESVFNIKLAAMFFSVRIEALNNNVDGIVSNLKAGLAHYIAHPDAGICTFKLFLHKLVVRLSQWCDNKVPVPEALLNHYKMPFLERMFYDVYTTGDISSTVSSLSAHGNAAIEYFGQVAHAVGLEALLGQASECLTKDVIPYNLGGPIHNTVQTTTTPSSVTYWVNNLENIVGWAEADCNSNEPTPVLLEPDQITVTDLGNGGFPVPKEAKGWPVQHMELMGKVFDLVTNYCDLAFHLSFTQPQKSKFLETTASSTRITFFPAEKLLRGTELD